MSDAYIRGAGAVLERPKALRVAAAALAVIMVTLAVILILEASGENARISRLQRNGVAVDVHVTSCVALLSGTGITEAGYTCRGTFTLNGQSYTETIGDTKLLYNIGQSVASVVDPANPANLYPAGPQAKRHTSLTGYVLPAVLLLVVLAGSVEFARRRRPTSTDA